MMFTHPSFCCGKGELKARAGWAVGIGLWAKGQRKRAAWCSGHPGHKHRSPLQPHQVTLNPPPGLGRTENQLHLGPSPHRAAPSRHLPRRAHLDGWGRGMSRPGAVIFGKKAGAPGRDPVCVCLPSANMARLSLFPEGQGRLKVVTDLPKVTSAVQGRAWA